MIRRRPTSGPRYWLGPLEGGVWWWLALLFMGGGVAIGFAGFQTLDQPGSTDDDLYRALQLLVLDDTSIDPVDGKQEDNEGVAIARWMAPIGVAMAAIRAYFLVATSEQERLRARRRREHTIVAGLGTYGSHIARTLRKARAEVVGIDLEGHPSHPSAVRDAGVAVVAGDAQTRPGLMRASLRHAREIVVTCGDDATNVEVGMQAARLAERMQTRLTVLVHLDDLALWRELRVRAAQRPPGSCRIEYFNCFETGARMLTERHPPPAGGHTPHVLLIGTAGVAPHLVLHLARWWAGLRSSADDMLLVSVAGPGAETLVRRLAAANPRLGDLARLEVAGDALDLSESGASGLLAAGDVDRAYVCGDDDAQALAAAMGLDGAARAAGVPVVLVLERDDRAIVRSLAGEGPMPGVEVFGLLSHALAPQTLRLGTMEILAQAAHEHYVRTERAKGIDERTNPSVTSWQRLPESLKASNRAFARRIGTRLEQLDCWLVPDPLAVVDPGAPLSSAEVERLAESEHEDWCEELRRSGWREGPSKDAESRIHHLLIPWNRLPEEERDKDRAAVAALPALVARAGFRMVRKPNPAGTLPSEVQGASVGS